uniref:C2 domain-containing protein n=1 Tax=Romanomermis culicivorax TaxID=13658 RepID=A0A915KCX6_ROMCU
MLTSRGHVFHIDFGKYLGETENFGSFKRDRTPFILTSDMVDVINCGETKSTPYFQDFVDYCCRAFNVVRNNYALFINLMNLMLKGDVPGLTEEAVKYVCANLWLDHSDSEASVRFTRMIEECMNNRFPKWNFLVHTLAQQRKVKSGRSDICELSFIPKVYSAESDGRISAVKLIGCEKWRIPEKVYMYKIQVDRENIRVPSYIYRSYKEIDEFSECLCLKFPSCKLPILPKDRGLGRTNVRSIAEHRIGYVFGFLNTLFNADDELAHSDLTYTFFHSILRDEQSSNFGRPETGLGRDSDNTYQNQIRGELKLCIEYKKRCLEIFVQHARNLALVSATVPDSYVKCYLRPDINRRSKRKTRIIRRSQNPTYNETLLYPWTWDTLNDKTLEISVWHSDVIRENAFIGGVQLDIKELLSMPNKRISRWFTLGNITTGQSFRLS